MASNIVEVVLRVVNQGASAAVNGLQNALNGLGGAAQHAGSAMQNAVSHTGQAAGHAATQTAHAAQSAATSAISSVQQAATHANTAIQHTAQAAGQTVESMGAKFAKLAAAIGAAAFFKSSVTEFATFESAMLKVQALSGAVGADFDALNAKAKELGASTKYTAAEAAEGMSQLAASGYNTAQILNAIGPAMYAAAAGGSDLGETADQLTNIMGAFQLEADQAGRVADVLTKGFTGAATTMSQLAYAMKPAGPIAKALGYSLEETVAVLQSLANVGYKGEQAGTILRNAMSSLLKDGADKLKEYGVEVKDAEGNVRKFADILEDMGKAGIDTADMLKIFGDEAGPGVQALLGQGADAIRDYEKALLSAGGKAKQTADHMESGLQGALNRLDAAWKGLKDSFGAAIAPAVSAVADALAALSGWFAKMPDWVKQALALGTAFAVFAGSVGGIASVVSAASAGFAALGVSMGGVAAVVAGVAAAIGVAVGAWKAFGDSAGGAAERHAQAAAKIAGDIEAEKKRIQELRDLQKTLLETAPGTKAHVEAEQRLAQILPGVNTHIDEQGRLVATLSDKTSENNRVLEENIALREKQIAARENERLREAALAYAAAADAVDRQAQEMRKLHEMAQRSQGDIGMLTSAMSGYDLAEKLREGAQESDKLNASLEKQKTAFQELAAAAARQGMSASQFLSILGNVPAEAKSRIVTEYITIMNQVKAEAEKTGKEIGDGAKKTGSEVENAGKVTAKELSKTYKALLQDVRRFQEEISGRQKSLTAELRNMARAGMNDADAWVDQRNAAKEYIQLAKQAADEARRAQASGDTITAAAKWKEAVQYADDAKAAYKALNQEVKDGDRVIVSAQTALKGAMRGVKEAGELGIEFLKEQEKAAADAAAAMEKHTSMADLTAGMDEAEKKWIEGWRKMRDEVEDTAQVMQEVWRNAAGFWTNVNDAFSAGWSEGADEFAREWNGAYARFEKAGKAAADAVKRAIDRAAEDRQTTIRIRTIETRRWGGLIGDALGLARGGKLPGYGGGDRVSALLEAGEYVVRKEAVKRFGAGFFDALNHLRVPDLSTLMPQMPQPALATPMGHMVLELKLPGGDSVTATVSKEDAETLARHNRRVSNLRFRR